MLRDSEGVVHHRPASKNPSQLCKTVTFSDFSSMQDGGDRLLSATHPLSLKSRMVTFPNHCSLQALSISKNHLVQSRFSSRRRFQFEKSHAGNFCRSWILWAYFPKPRCRINELTFASELSKQIDGLKVLKWILDDTHCTPMTSISQEKFVSTRSKYYRYHSLWEEDALKNGAHQTWLQHMEPFLSEVDGILNQLYDHSYLALIISKVCES